MTPSQNTPTSKVRLASRFLPTGDQGYLTMEQLTNMARRARFYNRWYRQEPAQLLLWKPTQH